MRQIKRKNSEQNSSIKMVENEKTYVDVTCESWISSKYITFPHIGQRKDQLEYWKDDLLEPNKKTKLIVQ